MKIQNVEGLQILDSRGNPTLEVKITSGRFVGSAAVPSGASTGKHEAYELRDKAAAYKGKSVLKAVKNVEKISKSIKGFLVDDQKKIDETIIKLDGTLNKKKLGANTLLGISMAATRVGAISHHLSLYYYLADLYENKKVKMPIPFANIINGGVHAGNDLTFQEFMIVPIKARSFFDATRIVSEIYHELKELLIESFGKEGIGVGDEGGFAPPLRKPEEALELMELAVKKAGHKTKVKFAMDVAASEIYNSKLDKYEVEPGKFFTREKMVEYYHSLVERFPIISIEDPFAEDDYEGWKMLMDATSGKVMIVGDDLTVTNPDRIAMAAQKKLCDTLLLKINQIGTITQAMQAAHLAQKAGWKVMVSHRSGETEDPYIADLVVGLGVGMIKLGAPCRGERTAKYNQLLRIEKELGKLAKY